MDAPLLRTACSRVRIAHRTALLRQSAVKQQRRCLATPADQEIRAAPPIQFDRNANQYARPHSTDLDSGRFRVDLMDRIRVVPASPSYFTATPQFTDDLLHLTSLVRSHQYLPVCPPGQAPRIAWKTYEQYVAGINEPVKRARYSRLLGLIKRLNYIHTPLMPAEVAQALLKFQRALQPLMNKPKGIQIDQWGRARGVGRRKTSTAQCFVVEGEGEVLINGRSLTEFFGRIHDRESAVWSLKATQRMDKYNVWAVVKGGGTTGQAEAVMLGVARALLAHEPDLKPALRRAGCLTRDPRRVERKKPGKLKARKMPAWVKR